MSTSSYDSKRRTPVVYRGERVRLYVRRDTDGGARFELRRKVGGKAVRRTLEAATVTDAIAEARRVSVKVENTASLVGSPSTTLGEIRDGFADWSSEPRLDRRHRRGRCTSHASTRMRSASSAAPPALATSPPRICAR